MLRLKPLFIVMGLCGAPFFCAFLLLAIAVLTEPSDGRTRGGGLEELSPTASPISIYKEENLGNLYYCEFHISQTEFESLARVRGWKLKPVDHTLRFTRFAEVLSRGRLEIRLSSHFFGSRGCFFEARDSTSAGMTVVFDQVHRTAYLLQHNR